jgi:hypothetical protein
MTEFIQGVRIPDGVRRVVRRSLAASRLLGFEARGVGGRPRARGRADGVGERAAAAAAGRVGIGDAREGAGRARPPARPVA